MSIKKATISNIKWSFIESISLQMVSFILSILLARLLEPSAFGVLAIVNVFYLLTTLFIDAGLKEALIQKANATHVDYSSVFWLNIAKSCFIYCCLFIAAPYIQDSYGFENLAFYIRLQSLTLIIEAFGLIQIVKATKDLQIKKITVARIPASLLSLLVGITLAYNGFGILSLIIQQLVNVFVYSLLLIINVKFIPLWVFDFRTVIPLYRFGVKLLGVSLISRFYAQSLNLIYAKSYSPAILGLYTKSNSIQNTPIEIINSPFLKGLYPTLVKLQDNTSQLKSIILQNIKLVTFLILLVNGIFFFQAYEIIKILLGKKWLEMEIYLKIASVGSIFFPINGQCQSIHKVKNKVSLFFRIELISKILGLITIFALISICSLSQILIVLVLITIFSSLTFFYFTSKILDFSFLNEVGQIFLLIICHAIAGFFVNYVVNSLFPDAHSFIKTLFFSILYIALSTFLFFILNRNIVNEIYNRNHFNKK
jgi:O-antigen/teichoic acid export membrane protein